MSYQVLARKWRPRNFQDMVGQEHILRMLSNALEQKRIHHAYLFTGTRGVGKTTIARILAKCLNCESGITSSPCGTCHICRAIDAGQFLDLYEVDAASRTKVEDTRELLENVMYPPTQGRYKIYLIDEVHMLSNHSFNALLKTLEEPPEHVKFLLATTDPKKLPVTILSRCLQFHLKRITPEHIAKHLQHICSAEDIKHETNALDKLATAADGSMRDALSLLDQAIAYGQGSVNKNEVYSMLGSMAQDDLLPLLEALASQNGAELFKTISQLAERAPDFEQVLEELINLLHKIALAQIVPETMNAQAQESFATFINRFSAEDVQLYYQIALLSKRDLSLTPSPQQGFEMAMLRMLAFKPAQPSLAPGAGASPNVTPAKTISFDSSAKHPQANFTTAATSNEASIADFTSASASASANTKTDTSTDTNTSTESSAASLAEWCDILPKLELAGMAYALAANCVLDKITENKITLTLSVSHQPMLNPKLKDRITEALTRHFKRPMQLDINITSDVLITPLKQEQTEHENKLANAKQTVMQNPQVKKLLDMYDATLEVSLI
jgi:DNA polymerase-3 subunit gamma/tau